MDRNSLHKRFFPFPEFTRHLVVLLELCLEENPQWEVFRTHLRALTTAGFRADEAEYFTTFEEARDSLGLCLEFREAARLGANIVCLPELFRTQYFCQREDLRLFDLAEPIPGPSTARLSELARELRVAIIASLFERRAPGLYHNTAVTLNADGAIASVYRKMHIPDDPLFYEKYYFAPGDLGFQAVDLAFGRVGTLVCWDQWYPEAARLTALQGAEALFYPTAIGWHPAEKAEFGAAQVEAWQTIQRSHAIANGVYVASVNRVGIEHGDVLGNRATGAGIEFWGGTFLADPFGVVIAAARTERRDDMGGIAGEDHAAHRVLAARLGRGPGHAPNGDATHWHGRMHFV